MPTDEASARAHRATAVIGMRLRPGAEGDFRAWQRGITAASVRQEGFQGIEMFPPVPGVQEDSVVVLRFETLGHLETWLASEERAGLLRDAEAFCIGPPSHQVLAGRSSTGMPVTEVITSSVRPGQEQDYLAWQREMDGVVAQAQGFLGTELFPPAASQQRDWTIVIRFDTTGHLDAWMESDARRRMLARAQPFTTGVEHRRVAFGFGAWFAGSARTGDLVVLPPRWKQALAVLLPLYPTVMLVALLVLPALGPVPQPLRTLFGSALSVVLLTWLGMPLANRLLGHWLHGPGTAGEQAATLAGVLLALAAMASAFLAFT